MALKWTGKSKGALANSANVQPKFTLQRLGQAIGLCTVAGAMGTMAMMPVTAQAMKTDFGMEYRATAFANQTDAFDNPNGSDSDTGFANLIRLKGNFLDENTGISVYTSVELAGDRWRGDDHLQGSPVPSYSSGDNTENVRLDLGYVQIPVGHTIFRVGRQAASYNNCFLVCDDRRDRILMIQPLSKSNTIVAGYDRRQDTTPYANVDNGDQAFLGIVSKLGGSWNASLLYVKWMNNYDGSVVYPITPYVLSNVDMFSGYLSGDLGPVKTTVGFNWEADGNVENPAADGVFFNDSSYAAYLRLEGNTGPLGLGLQLIGSRDGGLISPGFDTWSSMINNNPDATASASSMYTMGALGAGAGLGLQDFDQDLIIGKVSYNFTPKFSITGAVGSLNIDDGNDSDDSMVYDLRFTYQANKVLKTWLSLGMMEKNDLGTISGNSLTGVAGTAMTDDVKAASLNMTVDF